MTHPTRLRIDRIWDMPNADTMLVPSIRTFTLEYLSKSTISVDPFARNCRLATYTNDLNPDTAAEFYMTAIDFLLMLERDGVRPDLVIFDPPYSARQMWEVYQKVGLGFGERGARIVGRWSEERDCIARILPPDGVVLTYGWNSTGINRSRGFVLERILLVCHGAAHNDTICTAERRVVDDAQLFQEVA